MSEDLYESAVRNHLLAKALLDAVKITDVAVEIAVAKERDKVAQWMVSRGYATGHGDTVEDLLKELEWQIAENWTNALVKGVEGEREACAKVCDELDKHPDHLHPADCAEAIRARATRG